MELTQKPLEGKRALVTGGNRNIGEAIVRHLAVAGASVAINYVEEPELAEALVKELNQQFGEGIAHAIEADISDQTSVERLFEHAQTALGGLDILVNNAGIESMYPALDLPIEEWDRIMKVNLRGAFICAQTAAKMMKKQKTGGVIVNIASIHDSVARLGATHYCVSKAGLTMLTKVLALEWAEYGIRVVGVSPGAIETSKLRKGVVTSIIKNVFERWIPLKRFGDVDDVANAVTFVSSEAASYMTGTTINVDGAYSINVIRYDARKFMKKGQE
jgi:glucose 1-dehydrogenase